MMVSDEVPVAVIAGVIVEIVSRVEERMGEEDKVEEVMGEEDKVE